MTETRERDTNLDFVRIVAFLLLMCCHAADPFNAAATYGGGIPNPDFARWGAIWGSLVRPCVPLFVMLSGALLLPRGETSEIMDMKRFYSRRIPRVLWPFLIWSAVYYITPWIIGLLGYGQEGVLLFFPYATDEPQTFSAALGRICRIPYTFNFIAGHMWYIYMLVGLYLYLPIFSAWVRTATRRQKEFFLAMWLLASCLPYLGEFVSRYNYGTCEWNAFGLFYYFAGFNGYLLLGHYICTYVRPRRSLWRTLALAAVFIAGYAVTFFGFRYTQSIEGHTPEQTELFWTYCTPNVIAMSACLMLLLRPVKVSGRRVCALLKNFTFCGFGIYMVHYFFVGPAYWVTTALNVPLPLRIPAAAVLILLCSWAFVALLSKALGSRLKRIILG